MIPVVMAAQALSGGARGDGPPKSYMPLIVVGGGALVIVTVLFRKQLGGLLSIGQDIAKTGSGIANTLGNNLKVASKAVNSVVQSPAFNVTGKKGWGKKVGHVTGKKGWLRKVEPTLAAKHAITGFFKRKKKKKKKK